jgi:hypothetical protein
MDRRPAKQDREKGVSMLKYFNLLVFMLLLSGTVAAAEKDKKEEGEAKEVSGMSIVGNNETPKSLVIVPWKSSEIGQETKLNSNLLNDSLTPVDKDVFMRELEFYKLGNSN